MAELGCGPVNSYFTVFSVYNTQQCSGTMSGSVLSMRSLYAEHKLRPMELSVSIPFSHLLFHPDGDVSVFLCIWAGSCPLKGQCGISWAG